MPRPIQLQLEFTLEVANLDNVPLPKLKQLFKFSKYNRGSQYFYVVLEATEL